MEISAQNKQVGPAGEPVAGRFGRFQIADPESVLTAQPQPGRHVINAVNGENLAEGKAFNKKDASQIASQVAVEKLGLLNSDNPAANHPEN